MAQILIRVDNAPIRRIVHLRVPIPTPIALPQAQENRALVQVGHLVAARPPRKVRIGSEEHDESHTATTRILLKIP